MRIPKKPGFLSPWLWIVFIAVSCISILQCSGTKPQIYLRDPERILWDSTLTILVLPFDSVGVTYVDNTQLRPDSQFTDSFFIDAANSLLQFESMKLFKECKILAEIIPAPDSLSQPFPRYSGIAEDTTTLRETQKFITAIAEHAKADLVLFPYAASIRHVTYQQQSWRGGGPSYDRPVTYSASSTAHVQIWAKDGTIIYEKQGTNDAGRPVMYSLFGKKKKDDEDIAKFARHLYAPPLVRALYMSLKNAIRVRR